MSVTNRRTEIERQEKRKKLHLERFSAAGVTFYATSDGKYSITREGGQFVIKARDDDSIRHASSLAQAKTMCGIH